MNSDLKSGGIPGAVHSSSDIFLTTVRERTEIEIRSLAFVLRNAIGRARLGAALPLLLTSAGALTAAAAATPDPAFRGAERLVILCDVRLDRPGHEIVARDLCGRIKLIVEQDAPMPVEVVNIGEFARAPDGTVGLLTHASVSPASSIADGAKGELMSFSMRTMRTGAFAGDPAYFGAAPRVARYTPDSAGGQDLEQALRAALTEVLPWLNRAGQPTPTKRERTL